MKVRTAAAATLITLISAAMAGGPGSGPAGASPAAHTSRAHTHRAHAQSVHAPAMHTQSVHLQFENCPAATTILTASEARVSYSNHRLVNINVSITNSSANACGPSPEQVALSGENLVVGPCGEVSVDIDNARGVNVYPGRTGIACPAETGVPVPANGTLTAIASWNQRASYDSTHLAPRGRYELSIQQLLDFAIRLTGSSSGPLPTGPTPLDTPLTASNTPRPNNACPPRTGAVFL
jgi:hypothetical protein